MEEIRYCPMCGAYIPHDANKCLACGWIPSRKNREENIDTVLSGNAEYINGNKVVKQTCKADIDLDEIFQKEYYTIKLGGETEWYYTGKADMTIENTTYHTTDMFGQIVRFEDGKKKLHLCLIER